MNLDFKRKLPIPLEIKERYPLSEEAKRTKEEADVVLKNIFEGKDNRLLLIVGPCSADDLQAVLDYARKLKEIADLVKDKIYIIMRVYTTKPRSDTSNYKGILHNPDPSGKADMLKGLLLCRKLFMDVLEIGLGIADEMLYPQNHRYFSDQLSYVSVGARSTENQEHRLLASGLNIPVGFKNPLSGDLNSLALAIKGSRESHVFLYRGWETESKGNPLTHGIFRGFVKDGKNYANIDEESVKSFFDKIKDSTNPALLIDASHANSNKNPLLQKSAIFKGLDLREKYPFIKGFMIESYLKTGCQDPSSHIYGLSVTDACLGIDETKELILNLWKKL